MKRVVSSSIVTFLVLIAAAAAFLYIRNISGDKGDPATCIPPDAVFYVEATSVTDAIDVLLKPGAWSSWTDAPSLAALKSNLQSAQKLIRSGSESGIQLSKGTLFVSAHVTGAGTFDFLYLKGMSDSRSAVASALNELAGADAHSEDRQYDGNTITEITLKDGRTFTWTLVKGVFAGSFTSFLVEDALRQQKVGKPAVWSDAAVPEKSFRFYLSFAGLPSFFSQYTRADFDGFSALRNFSSWFTADVTASSEGLLLTGSLQQQDTLRFTGCFRDQQPVSAALLQTIPASAATVVWFGASNMERFRKHLDRYLARQGEGEALVRDQKHFGVDIRKLMTNWVTESYALVVTEPASSQYDNNVYAVFHTIDPEKASRSLKALTTAVDKKLGERTREEDYHEYQIRYLRLQGVIPALYGNRFSKLNRMYYALIGKQVVFANQASSLRNYIDEVRAGHFFASYTKGILPAKGANFVCMVRPSVAAPIFNAIANPTWKNASEKYQEAIAGSGMFTFMVSAAGDQLNATARLDRVGPAPASARMLFSIDTDTSVTMSPLLVQDKVSGAGRIVFQDDAFVLHMADDAGNEIWSTRLDSRIRGNIYPVDFFRNGKMQFLFNTTSHIHLIDFEGKPVGNYPIRLPSAATNAMTLTAAEGIREPVIYVACDNHKVYAYLLSGKPLQGWGLVGTSGFVKTPVFSFKSDGRQLLLISDSEGTSAIVSPTGNPAISLSQGFAVAEYGSVFTDTSAGATLLLVASDENGNIIKVGKDGRVELIAVAAAGPGHGFLYADTDSDGQREYLFSSEREVVAYDQSMAVLYRMQFEGDLSGGIIPISFPNGDPGFVVYSTQVNKTWVCTMDGKIAEGFPVRGSGGITVGSLHADGKINLITGSSGNGVFVYSLN